MENTFETDGIYEEAALVRYLRFKRGFYACDEVALYGGIADVLALDHRKKEVYEFEFKRSSIDLKRNELKKYKYTESKKRWVNNSLFSVRVEHKRPHKFYFVVPLTLWEKEKEYLNSLSKVGVISFYTKKNGKYEFVVTKSVRKREANTQKYEVAEKALLNRLSNAYSNLLFRKSIMKKDNDRGQTGLI